MTFLADLLPHETILDDVGGILLLSTPSRGRSRLALGCAWAVEPVNVEVVEEGRCLDLARRHEALVRGLPVGAALQVLWSLRPSTQMPAWEALRAGLAPDVPHRPLLEAQHRLLQAGFPHQHGGMLQRLRASQTLVTVRVPLPSISPAYGSVVRALCQTPGRSVATVTAAVREQLQTAMIQFQGIAGGVYDSLRAAGHQATQLSGQAVGHAVARALDPDVVEPAPITPAMAVRVQVSSTALTSCPGGLVGAQQALRVLSLHRAPPQTYPGLLCAPRAPTGSQPLALWDVWPGPLVVAVNLAITEPDSEKRRLDWKLLLATVQQALSASNRELKKRLEQVLRTMFVSGGGVMWGRVHLGIWGEPASLDGGAAALIRAGRRLGLEFAPEPDLGSTLALQMLPLGFDPAFPSERHLQRGRRLERHTLMDLLPLYGGFRGTGTAQVAYLNRRGETVDFWPFDSHTNAHLIIKGSPGSGKSFSTAHFFNQVLPLGAAGIILDRLPSYADLVRTWGGRNLVMDFRAPICFNPFYGPLDDAHVATATAILAHMASGSNVAHALDQEHLGVLATGVGTFAKERRGGEEPTLGQFWRDHLMSGHWTEDRRTKQFARNIARRLGQFVGDGAYAGFTDGRNQLELDPVLTVIELSQLGEASDLQGVLLLSLMHHMSVFYSDPSRIAQRKYFFCDEVWKLLQHVLMGSLLEDIGLTYRKLGVCCAFISQLASHFATGAGATLRNIAAFQLFLEQEASEIPQVAAIFDFTPAEVALFESGEIRRHAHWSSAYLRMAGGTGGVVRILADGVTRWQVSQQDGDRAVRAAAMAHAPDDLWRVMAQLAHDSPQGVA